MCPFLFRSALIGALPFFHVQAYDLRARTLPTGTDPPQAHDGFVTLSLHRREILAVPNPKRSDFIGLETGSDVSRRFKKTVYYGNISIGTPAQVFSVVYDTGSGNLIVPGSSCPDAACENHQAFDMEGSTSGEYTKCYDSEDDPEVTVYFGTGQITGRCARDNICIGGLCMVGQFLSATSESSFPFADFRFDGVLGLSLEGMGFGPEFSLVSRLRRAALAVPVFSVFLSESTDEASEIAFGGIEKSRMASDLFWIDVSEGPGYWEIRINDLAVGGKKLGICEGCRVAIDTGTSELAGPTDVVDSLLSILDIQQNCSNFDDLPNIGVHVGGHILGLARHNYVNKESGYCAPSFMHMDLPPPEGPLLIFGIPFLTKFYTVFDMEKRRIGFSLAHHTTVNSELFVKEPSGGPLATGVLNPHQRL